MPIHFTRALLSTQRNPVSNRRIGLILTFVAGATNAGGFLAVKQYTSHMTGIVSSIADNLAVGTMHIVWAGVGALLAFLMGAASTSILVNYSRRRQLHSRFAIPLLIEAILLLCFGILGAQLARIHWLFVPFTAMLLCFIMGLQNALITKLSNAEIRTTHLTGIITDIGIELGKLFYWNSSSPEKGEKVEANRERLLLLVSFVLSFFVGAISGALGFKHLGYISTVPLAIALIALAIIPAVDDVKAWISRSQTTT